MTPEERAAAIADAVPMQTDWVYGGEGEGEAPEESIDLDELRAMVAAAIRAAVAAEREACAALAEYTGRLHPLFADQILQKAIAEAIRARGKS